jgi:hypothetical protein
MGWTGLSNGALLREASVAFDVVVTADQRLEFRQNLAALPIAVVVLVAPANRMESLQALIPNLLRTLGTLEPKKLVRVGA